MIKLKEQFMAKTMTLMETNIERFPTGTARLDTVIGN